MKKALKIFAILIIVSIVFICIFIFSTNWLFSVFIGIVLLIIFFEKKIINKINWLWEHFNNRIKESNWYYNHFPHLENFKNLQQNLDLINLGSGPAQYSLDYSDVNINATNLAVGPQTISYDFQVLKNYHSYLKKNGIILFVLCPFTFCKDFYRNENGSTIYMNIRYYPILHRALIDNYDCNLYKKWVEYPLLQNIKNWRFLLKDCKRSCTLNITKNNLSKEEMIESAEYRINGWMKEFSMKSLKPDELPEKVKNSIQFNCDVFKSMISFANERTYKCLVIIPPFSEELTDLMPPNFVETCLYAPLKKIGLAYISYLGVEKYFNSDYYYDAFLMNKKGRLTFTKDVIEDITHKGYL